MDNKIQILEERYWAGETSVEEELVLKQAASADDVNVSDALKSLFAVVDEAANKTLEPSFENDFWQTVEAKEAQPRGKIVAFNTSSFLRYAAVGILLVAFSFAIGNLIFKFNADPVSPHATFASLEDTYDNPEQAYLEMKRALMFASTKLNKGTDPIKALKKFDEGMSAMQLSH